ncbi:MAG TPA: DUF488 domain-containing protein [Gemmatimonadota bacterium]|nr:DUF488 domain-containing protein [Gemmatimonadota bacterium]
MARAKVKLKRAYEPPEAGDGMRILVDRLWPRGVSKEAAAIDLWLKEIAPSIQLRQWFAHDPRKWPRFRERYFAELDANPEPVEALRKAIRRGPVTIVYSAKDEEHNDAVALREYLGSRTGSSPARARRPRRSS